MMEESEKWPLLGKENKGGKPEDSTRPNIVKSRNKCRIFTGVTIVACIIIIAAISGTVAFGVKFALYKNNDLECQKINHSPIKAAQSRSGISALLDNITSQDLMCYAKPLLHLSLKDGDSSVEIYQIPCQDIETQPFLTHYDFNDLPSAEGPRPLFDENFSPQNYFMKGNIEIKIINATTTSTSRDIDLCLFSDYYQYNSFLKAGIKWKNRTENAVCKTVTSIETDHMVLFNISEPTFAFIGMATTYPVQVDLINITAIGQDISGLGKNSTRVCQLNGEAATCNLSLSNELESKNQSICIVAYEEGNPDGTYDYSNLTIEIPNQVKHDNTYKLRFKIYGYASLGVIVIITTLFMSMLIVGAINVARKKILRRLRNKSTADHKQHSVQSAQVTCDPVEATTQHDTKSAEQSLVSVAGIAKIIQQSQKHQSHGEEISVD